MIPFASQRGNGQDLATHLLNQHDNEIAELTDLRGAIADDLHGAFKEWETQAKALTRCREYLYGLSINPDPAQGPLSRTQYLDYISRTEEALGLTDQPRAVVFHTKYGREHCHVVWSRIDTDRGRAVHLAFDRDKLMRVTRGFARDHGLHLPEGYTKSKQIGQLSLYEKSHERETGLTKEDHTRNVTDAWRQSDNAKAFVHSLAERGYILATGKRPFILVDLYGNMHALAKLIDDKSVRTADLRSYLNGDFPPESLPSVEHAKGLVAAHRKLIEKSSHELQAADALAALRKMQAGRKSAAVAELEAFRREHHDEREAARHRYRVQRDDQRHQYQIDKQERRQQRIDNAPTGLAAFLGKVSGFALLQIIKARRTDARMLSDYRNNRKQLIEAQRSDEQSMERRMKFQLQDATRKIRSMEKVEKRELAALLRDTKAQSRVLDREGGQMQSVAGLVPYGQEPTLLNDLQLSSTFRDTMVPQEAGAVDLTSCFTCSASLTRENLDGGNGQYAPVVDQTIDPPLNPHDKGRDR